MDDNLITRLVVIAEKHIVGHYRKKAYFVEFIRCLDRVDLNNLDEFRNISTAFDEALDLAQFSGVR